MPFCRIKSQPKIAPVVFPVIYHSIPYSNELDSFNYLPSMFCSNELVIPGVRKVSDRFYDQYHKFSQVVDCLPTSVKDIHFDQKNIQSKQLKTEDIVQLNSSSKLKDFKKFLPTPRPSEVLLEIHQQKIKDSKKKLRKIRLPFYNTTSYLSTVMVLLKHQVRVSTGINHVSKFGPILEITKCGNRALKVVFKDTVDACNAVINTDNKIAKCSWWDKRFSEQVYQTKFRSENKNTEVYSSLSSIKEQI